RGAHARHRSAARGTRRLPTASGGRGARGGAHRRSGPARRVASTWNLTNDDRSHKRRPPPVRPTGRGRCCPRFSLEPADQGCQDRGMQTCFSIALVALLAGGWYDATAAATLGEPVSAFAPNVGERESGAESPSSV